jgi:hypothetical protein
LAEQPPPDVDLWHVREPGGEHRDNQCFPKHHPPHLPWRRADRPQQCHLPIPLLDGQPENARYDEYRDHDRQTAEHRGNDDQGFAARAYAAEFGQSSIVPGQHRNRMPLECRRERTLQLTDIGTGLRQHSDVVDLIPFSGKPLGVGVGEEDRRILIAAYGGTLHDTHNPELPGLSGDCNVDQIAHLCFGLA